MNQIYAYTEPNGSYPAFVNLSESSPGVIAFTVRTKGNNGGTVATISLDLNELKIMADHINGYLGTPTRTLNEGNADAGLAALNKVAALLEQQVALMQASRDDHREAMARYDAMTQTYQTTAVIPQVENGAAIPIKTITFEEFVQYGRDNGGNIVNGMPWSFTFHGRPVTHENDRCYIIADGTLNGLRFTPDEVLVVSPDGSLVTMLAQMPGL